MILVCHVSNRTSAIIYPDKGEGVRKAQTMIYAAGRSMCALRKSDHSRRSCEENVETEPVHHRKRVHRSLITQASERMVLVC